VTPQRQPPPTQPPTVQSVPVVEPWPDEPVLALRAWLFARDGERDTYPVTLQEVRTVWACSDRTARRALQQAGLYNPDLELLTPRPSSVGLGAELFLQLMQSQPQVDAIFFGNDDLAQGALLQALRMGVSVPNDVAVAGFNDLPQSALMVPPLTTVRTPRAEVGRHAAALLLEQLRGEPTQPRALDLGFEVVERDST